jgi:formyl-CoA transferase
MVDVALVDSVFASLENIPQRFFVDGNVPARNGNRYEFIYPYDSFRAEDGWIIIGIANNTIWKRFVEASEIKAFESDKRFETNKIRLENHESLKLIIEEWTSKRKVNDIVTFLTNRRIPACPIYDIKDASEDFHISKARNMIVEQEHPKLGMVKLMGNPIKMSETHPSPTGPAPFLGGDTIEILEHLLGVTNDDIMMLRKEGVI